MNLEVRVIKELTVRSLVELEKQARRVTSRTGRVTGFLQEAEGCSLLTLTPGVAELGACGLWNISTLRLAWRVGKQVRQVGMTKGSKHRLLRRPQDTCTTMGGRMAP